MCYFYHFYISYTHNILNFNPHFNQFVSPTIIELLKIYQIIGNILNLHSENILENLTFISQIIFHKKHNIVVLKMPLVTIVC